MLLQLPCRPSTSCCSHVNSLIGHECTSLMTLWLSDVRISHSQNCTERVGLSKWCVFLDVLDFGTWNTSESSCCRKFLVHRFIAKFACSNCFVRAGPWKSALSPEQENNPVNKMKFVEQSHEVIYLQAVILGERYIIHWNRSFAHNTWRGSIGVWQFWGKVGDAPHWWNGKAVVASCTVVWRCFKRRSSSGSNASLIRSGQYLHEAKQTNNSNIVAMTRFDTDHACHQGAMDSRANTPI